MMRRFASVNAAAVATTAVRGVRATPKALAGPASVVPAFASPLASQHQQPQGTGRFLHNHNHRANPSEPSCVEAADESLIFYFEADTAGMNGYRAVATQVSEGQLPGCVENAQVSGFATWKVPRDEYAKVVAAHMPFLL